VSTGELIYKILERSAWEAACALGVYHGSADDQRDGFIHFSCADQVDGTLQKYFAGKPDLVLVSVSAAALGPALRYEASRGGASFPHLYGALPTALALEVVALG
jgi:uncharacterized protein (DUF952 family)